MVCWQGQLTSSVFIFDQSHFSALKGSGKSNGGCWMRSVDRYHDSQEVIIS
jgi:hypothetical protein